MNAPDSNSSTELSNRWLAKQAEIARNVVSEDDNNFASCFAGSHFTPDRDLFIAGADISFSTTLPDHAIGTVAVVVLRVSGRIDLVYSSSRTVSVKHPYIPSFLGFREAPVVSEMLAELPSAVRDRLDCLLLDGNGLLHPRKAGLACHVGVEENLATIGVSKALLCVDGLVEREVRELAVAHGEEGVDVIGVSGTLWGRAIITGNALAKPIYVSVGNKVSLKTAAKLVRQLCKFRVPEPIRMADLHSRALLRGEDESIYKAEEFLYTALPTEST